MEAKSISQTKLELAQLSPDQTFQVIQIALYVLAFIILVLIFIYIAYERPSGDREKERERESREKP